MWRATLALGAALALVAPSLAHAQFSTLDRQDPTEYNDQDSQLLNIVSYGLRPIGYMLEWGVARPLHYLATSSAVAPVLGANTDEESEKLPPVTELPLPDDIQESTEHKETLIKRYEAPAASSSPASLPAGSQPVLH